MNILDQSYRAFVNLEHRKDRLEHMTEQLSRIGMTAERHRGILPNELKHKPGIQTMMNRTPGAVGCLFSQMGIMEKALELDRHAMVLEDDCIFCEDFNERMNIANEFLNGNAWDILWGGGTFHVPAFWHKIGRSGMEPNCSLQLGYDCQSTDNPRMVRTFGAFSTYAYIVNKNSIQKVLDLLNDFMPKTIGIDYSFIALGNKLTSFAFVPGCVRQLDNQSDIGDGMTIFSSFSKLNGTTENSKYWFQDRMEDFDPSTFNFNA